MRGGSLNGLVIGGRALDAERMAWTAPQASRQETPYVAGERPMLEAWLDFHRQTLLMKCGGLTADSMYVSSKSTWTCRASWVA